MPLQVPYEHRPYLRQKTIDRLDDLRREVRRVVHERFPLQENPDHDRSIASQRKRLIKRAHREALTFVVEYCARKVPTAKHAREIYELARTNLPTSRHLPGRYHVFYTRRREWADFADLFDRFRQTDRAKGHGSRQPEYTVFGYLVANLSDEELRDIVLESGRRLPELKEVIAWPARSLPSPLQL